MTSVTEPVPTIEPVTLAEVIVLELTTSVEASTVETTVDTSTAAEAAVTFETTLATRAVAVSTAAESAFRTEGIPSGLSRTEDGEDSARSSDLGDGSVVPRPIAVLTRCAKLRPRRIRPGRGCIRGIGACADETCGTWPTVDRPRNG